MCHVRRQANKPKYVLAQYVKDIANFVIWIEKNLSIIEPSLTQDVLNFSFLMKVTYFLFMRGITWHVRHLQKIFLFVSLIQIEEGTEGLKKIVFYVRHYVFEQLQIYNYNNWYLDSELAQMFSSCNLWRSFNVGEYKRQSQRHSHDTRRWPT